MGLSQKISRWPSLALLVLVETILDARRAPVLVFALSFFAIGFEILKRDLSIGCGLILTGFICFVPAVSNLTGGREVALNAMQQTEKLQAEMATMPRSGGPSRRSAVSQPAAVDDKVPSTGESADLRIPLHTSSDTPFMGP
eukprot:TRINITY_DN676_c0_g1_i1.p1 TRINITY_DN676_c0_g1~~TRINITY_DN676_c0_g1_i1.p1  ORF type:complete len:141 (+),score=12.67 TRINITY_DN676_c0_g1_i1:102-524(+)